MSLRRFYAENGLYVTTAVLWRRLSAFPRNVLLGIKLRSSGLRIGRHAKLFGLSRVRVGKSFHAGDWLWLETIPRGPGNPLEPLIVIGDNVALSDFVRISAATRVDIGDNVLTGSRVYISDNNHGTYSGPV